jgi:hypothetical protein
MRKKIRGVPTMQRNQKIYPVVPIAAKRDFLIGCALLAATMENG